MRTLSARAKQFVLWILVFAVTAAVAYVWRVRESAGVVARYAQADCLSRNVRLDDSGSTGWQAAIHLEGGEVLIAMRDRGKGQKVTAKYADALVEVASAGDLANVVELRLANDEQQLYVGIAGGLYGTDGWLVEYDLNDRRAERFAVEPSRWPTQCAAAQ